MRLEFLKIIKEKLPHFSRIISATAFIFRLGIVILLFFFLNGVIKEEFLSDEISNVLQYPQNYKFHFDLGLKLFSFGAEKDAEREFILAQNFFPKKRDQESSTILGKEAEPLDVWQKLKDEPGKIKKEISFWETFLQKNPDYRLGFAKLAYLYASIREKQKAQELLSQAAILGQKPKSVVNFEKFLENKRP